MRRYSPFDILFGTVVSTIVSAIVFAPVFLPAVVFRHIVIQVFPVLGVIFASFAGAGSIFAIIRWMNTRAVKRPATIQDGPPISD